MNLEEKIQKRAMSLEDVRSNILDYISKIEDAAVREEMTRRCKVISEKQYVTEAEIVWLVFSCLLMVAALICFVVSLLFVAIVVLIAGGLSISMCDSAHLASFDNMYDDYSQLFIDVMSILTKQERDKNVRDWEDTKERLFGGLSNIVSVANESSQESALSTEVESTTTMPEGSADTATASESQKKGVNLRKFDIVQVEGSDGEIYPTRVYR